MDDETKTKEQVLQFYSLLSGLIAAHKAAMELNLERFNYMGRTLHTATMKEIIEDIEEIFNSETPDRALEE